jgi:hypothetical protein
MTIQHTTESRELALYAVNDRTCYNQACAIIESLQKKVKAGKYDENKAQKAWYNLAVFAAKRYAVEFDSAINWSKMFSVADRKLAALDFANHYKEQIFQG